MFNQPSKWMWAAILSLGAVGAANAHEPTKRSDVNEKKVETVVDDIQRLRQGDRNIEARSFDSLTRTEVMELQHKLKSMDLYTGRVDGIIGPKTRAAVGAFQERENLQITGRLDSGTLRELDLDFDRQPVRGGEYSRISPVPEKTVRPVTTDDEKIAKERTDLRGKDRVLKVQDLNDDQRDALHTSLKKAGFYKGDVDAEDRSESQMAVRQFQASKNLPATGMLDGRTLDALGLNFDVQPVRGSDDDDDIKDEAEKDAKETYREAKDEMREERNELRREMQERE